MSNQESSDRKQSKQQHPHDKHQPSHPKLQTKDDTWGAVKKPFAKKPQNAHLAERMIPESSSYFVLGLSDSNTFVITLLTSGVEDLAVLGLT